MNNQRISVARLAELPLVRRIIVSRKYLDANQHMNTRWYLHIYTDGVWKFLEDLGIDDDYRKTSHSGTVALRQVIDYFREVKYRETISIRSRLIGYSKSKQRIHHVHFMINETTGELASIMEGHSAHFDINAGRISKFPIHISNKITTLLEIHSKLDWQVSLSGAIKL